MKITVMSAYFEPEITPYTHLIADLCRDWASYGAEVTVITGMASRGLDEATRQEYLNRTDEYLTPNIRVRRIGPKSKEPSQLWARGLRYLYQTHVQYKTARDTDTDVYFIGSTPPFLGVLGTWLKKKAPTLYTLHDIFPDSLINTGRFKEDSLIIRLGRRMEQFTYQQNSHIHTISEDFKEILVSRGVPENKISLVYNWIDEQVVVPIEKKDNILISRYGIDPSKYIVTHCGNIGHSQNLEMVVDIAAELEKELPDLEFIIIGDGGTKIDLERYVQDKGAGNVRILPFQPYEDIAHVMSLGDVSLVCSKRNVGTSSFPSKTWSIMSAARPVISSFDLNSELCTIINRANSGLCSDAEDKQGLKNDLLTLYNDRPRAAELGQNGRQYIEKNLTRKAATKQYYDIFTALVQAEGHQAAGRVAEHSKGISS